MVPIKWKDIIKRITCGTLIAAGLASPLGNSYSALAQDKEHPNANERSVAEKQFENPDQFWIQNYDSDSRMEGVFADNQKDGTLIASYPVGEKDGETYNKMFFIPNETTEEIRADDLDKDGRKEFSVFTDKSVLDFNWNVSEQDYDIDKYPSPEGKEITDGNIINGKPVVSVDEMFETYHPALYQMEDGKWKPFEVEGFDAEDFAGEVSSKAVRHGLLRMTNFAPQEFAYGDANGDGDKEVVIGNMGSSRPYDVFAIETDGDYETEFRFPVKSKPFEIQITNLDPWDNKRNDTAVANRKYLRAYSENPEGSKGPYYASFWNKSGKEITDFQNFPYRDALPEGAKEAEGKILENGLPKWTVDYWLPAIGYDVSNPILPWLISTENSGIRQDNDRDFRSSEMLNIGPNYRDFQKYSQDADLETLNLNNRN